MAMEKRLKKFAKEKGYSFKERCTGRYEISRDYEMMSVGVCVDDSEARLFTTPKPVPLILASAVLAAAFLPLIVIVYIAYALLSGLRVRALRNELKWIKVKA